MFGEGWSKGRLGLVVLVASASGALAVGAGACAPDEKLAPTQTAPPDDAGPPVDAGPDAPSETPIRKVMTRNPLGATPTNLLADGDFELSVVSNGQAGGQYAWNGFGSDNSRIAFVGETGGLCRSGLRCAHMKKGQLLLGRGTAAPDKAALDASIWIKPLGLDADPPSNEVCKNLATVYLIRCDTGVIGMSLKSASEPDADGWCESSIEGANGSNLAVCMYLEMKSEALVDQATLSPSSKTSNLASLEPAPPEDQVRTSAIADILRRQMRFDDGKAPREAEAPH